MLFLTFHVMDPSYLRNHLTSMRLAHPICIGRCCEPCWARNSNWWGFWRTLTPTLWNIVPSEVRSTAIFLAFWEQTFCSAKRFGAPIRAPHFGSSKWIKIRPHLLPVCILRSSRQCLLFLKSILKLIFVLMFHRVDFNNCKQPGITSSRDEGGIYM